MFNKKTKKIVILALLVTALFDINLHAAAEYDPQQYVTINNRNTEVSYSNSDINADSQSFVTAA